MITYLIIYLVVGFSLFLTWVTDEYPKYIAQVVFWPLWVIIEVLHSLSEWIENIDL